ncbi:SDR family oxidoreductase [Pontibacter sp. E15-1]|uniref:SDR family NAD(P)-dependent oxidoreductase n=1 Tax=Pontibacter sp. E15-1 TaxID=2919918 RepID=UPI001F4F8DD8|nr:SDR family oxidoreductase [Pontibacter sp. E15-1]MCJ8165670.1 SDR family oxidoreductase [Pontibacter sp. E15-1]
MPLFHDIGEKPKRVIAGIPTVSGRDLQLYKISYTGNGPTSTDHTQFSLLQESNMNLNRAINNKTTMDLKIKGKTAVITGGDSGMGLATAKILASEGVNIVLSDKTHEELEKAAEEVRAQAKNDSKVIAISADLTINGEVLKLADQTKAEFGGADMLVNCAGIRGAAGDFLNLSDEDWYTSIDVDLMGAVRVCRAFIPQMQEKKWGRIVLIASENAMQSYEEESPYNACKAGIVNLTNCLTRAYAREGLMINCVSPAYVATPMTDAMMDQLAKERNSSKEEAIQWFLKNKRPNIVVDRRGKPEEVAAVIAFLCSEHVSYVTGSNYRVDGGAVGTAFG